MKIGIVGLPNVGKSTLFKALTRKQIDIANYPFCTIQPNSGIVKVPDERLAALAKTNTSEQIIPASIEFVDIAGLVKGAHTGEGLGNQFLSHIREVDAIAHVVRVFRDTNIIHVAGDVDPLGDIETIHLELIFADLATLEKKLVALKAQLKAGQDKIIIQHIDIVERIKKTLEEGHLANTLTLSEEEKKTVKELNLLTTKPFIFIFNTNESGVIDSDIHKNLIRIIEQYPSVLVCGKLEAETADLSPEELVELDMTRTGLDALIKTAYTTLSLITYFTSGPKETRAWTIKKGTKAPQAAGVIHTDFEKGFIRAEIISWKDLVTIGGEIAVKEKGLIRLEGKEYIMQDGDVAVFRFA